MSRTIRFNAVLPIIIINIVFFLLQKIIAGFTDSLLLVSSDIFARPWILLTSMFLHGSFAHLLFNMYALFLFGTLIEQRIGTKRFLILYFTSGILASLGFGLFQEVILGTTGAGLGASGGVMGVLGMTIMLLPHLRVLFFFVIPMSMRTAGIMFAIIDLLGVFGIGIPGIANVAHLVGLVVGIGYGAYLLNKKKQFQQRFTGIGRSKNSKHSKKPIKTSKSPNNTHNYSSDSIELSKEDIDNYIRNGRL